MSSIESAGPSLEKVSGSQPSWTKRGLTVIDKSSNPSSEAEKSTNTEIDTPPQTPPGNSIDITV